MFSKLEQTIASLSTQEVNPQREASLDLIVSYVKESLKVHGKCNLNFICTHNSRRSQLAQAWAYALAAHFRLPVHVFSGGVEVTAFYPAAVNCLINQGFEIEKNQGENPEYKLTISTKDDGLIMKSKTYDDLMNKCRDFAAIMVCDHADQNCPFIPNAVRFSLPFQDPKASDGTPEQETIYATRSLAIATELHYIFSKVTSSK